LALLRGAFFKVMNKKEMFMSVTFKCIKTGNTVTFKSQYDIESMRQHPEYSEVLFLLAITLSGTFATL